MHETWNAVVWHVDGDGFIGYGMGLQGQGVENGKVGFGILIRLEQGSRAGGKRTRSVTRDKRE